MDLRGQGLQGLESSELPHPGAPRWRPGRWDQFQARGRFGLERAPAAKRARRPSRRSLPPTCDVQTNKWLLPQPGSGSARCR